MLTCARPARPPSPAAAVRVRSGGERAAPTSRPPPTPKLLVAFLEECRSCLRIGGGSKECGRARRRACARAGRNKQGGTSMGARDFLPSLRPLPSPLLASPHCPTLDILPGGRSPSTCSRGTCRSSSRVPGRGDVDGPCRVCLAPPAARFSRIACAAVAAALTTGNHMVQWRCGADDKERRTRGAFGRAGDISLGLVAAAQPWVAPSQIIPRFINLTISQIL